MTDSRIVDRAAVLSDRHSDPTAESRYRNYQTRAAPRCVHRQSLLGPLRSTDMPCKWRAVVRCCWSMRHRGRYYLPDKGRYRRRESSAMTHRRVPAAHGRGVGIRSRNRWCPIVPTPLRTTTALLDDLVIPCGPFRDCRLYVGHCCHGPRSGDLNWGGRPRRRCTRGRTGNPRAHEQH